MSLGQRYPGSGGVRSDPRVRCGACKKGGAGPKRGEVIWA